ncbi:MAG: FHA domain-containing protein [bacterium]|nr:FHA domain-containing protein [bacterium]
MEFIVHEKSGEHSSVAWAGKQLIIGRREDADIRLEEPTMSGIHAKIFAGVDGIRIRDLNSLNGTQINGSKIVESRLRSGDQIKIGRATIVVSGSGADFFDDSTEEVSVTGEDWRQSAQTLKIHLDELRQAYGANLDEDHHILLLRNLFEALQSAGDRKDVLLKVRSVLQRAFREARIFILQPDSSGWRDFEPDAEGLAPSMTFAAEAARTSSAILSSSLTEDQRFSGSESARISGIATAIAAPVIGDGEPLAVLYVDRLRMPPFSRRDLNILGIAANHVSAVLENVARIEDLRRTNQELMEARERLAELNRDLERLVEERTTEIRRQADQIGLLAEAKDELLGIAAHDIRGPLTVIQGTSELLRMKAHNLDQDTLKRSLDLMHGACRGLGNLLSELLDAKAIETGKITLERRRSNVGSLFEDALPVARLAAEDKDVDLLIEIDDDLEIDADPRRLGQAITNLVLNAVKFSGPGGRIVLRGSAPSPRETRIEVEDEGVGIPEDELEGIFGTFEQGKAGRAAGGSGLGLMIARRLVELHGGTLSVTSEVGVGTCFVLSVPASS